MDQLQYHGKKTVPAALRRDMWTPYFSVHFPPTEFGAEAGKLAYRRLRELSLQRQLTPPKDLVTTTEEDVEEIKSRHDPVSLKDRLEHREVILPQLGERLPKRLRAKRLMDQKATAVADVAFVLGLHLEGPTPAERQQARLRKFKSRFANMGRRAKTRLGRIRLLEARKRDLIRSLASHATSMNKSEGQLTLDRHTAARISMEYQGRIAREGGVQKLALIEAAKVERATEAELQNSLSEVEAQIDALLKGQALPEEQERPHGEVADMKALPFESSDSSSGTTVDAVKTDRVEGETEVTTVDENLKVKVMWADMRDGTYAQEWPVNVLHGELERRAVAKARYMDHSGWDIINQDGQHVSVPPLSQLHGYGNSVHVVGAEEGSGWTLDPKEISALRQRSELEYEKRKEAAVAVMGLVEKAVLILEERMQTASSEEILKDLRAQSRQMKKAGLREKEERKEEGSGPLNENWRREEDDLETQWCSLDPAEKRGVDKRCAMIQAQLLRHAQLREQMLVAAETTKNRADEAKRSADELKKVEGIEVNLPKSGLYDRLKAMIWRR